MGIGRGERMNNRDDVVQPHGPDFKIAETNADEQYNVYDYMEEFVEALMKQLRADNKRWGSTWRRRPKKGQVPWLKIVGNAMICWIREQHPEILGKLIVEFPVNVELKKGLIEEYVKDQTRPIGVQEPLRQIKNKMYPIVHVVDEKIESIGSGLLSYHENRNIACDGGIVLSSVIFSIYPNSTPRKRERELCLGCCDKQGRIHSAGLVVRLEGHVAANGSYTFTCLKGFNLAEQIYVTYDYEYAQ